jgi:hypothetical protein
MGRERPRHAPQAGTVAIVAAHPLTTLSQNLTNELRWLQTQTCSYKIAKNEDDQFAYTAAAKAVIAKFGKGRASLGVPTWFYGNEPNNVFATTIAKFFSNGIWEDFLVSIAMGGLVIAPGSAGTRQEIFMDMTQNIHASFCYRSPVVFLGVDYWGAIPTETSKDGRIVEREDDRVYSLVRKLTPPEFRGRYRRPAHEAQGAFPGEYDRASQRPNQSHEPTAAQPQESGRQAI